LYPLYSRIIVSNATYHLAESGYLPKIFASRSKYGTPKAGIILNTIVIITFSCANFGQLLELLNSVYAISLLMEYAAFVKLRLYHKECELFIIASAVYSFISAVASHVASQIKLQ